MIPYLIAGAIGFVVAKIFDEDEAPKYDDGGFIKIKSFKSNEGEFDVYDVDENHKNRADMFVVFKDKKGWVVRNVIVPKEYQRKGIATKFYINMNEMSLKNTGKPLHSTQTRKLSNGQIVHELSEDGIAFWDSLVRDGYAKKISEKNYVFIHNEFSNGGLVAPNGKPSKLTPEQYKLVRKPAFKKWFGDWENDPANASKVVDENGEPLVVYHGTRSDDFYEFENKLFGYRGFYFTDKKSVARNYGSNIRQFFLNSKNFVSEDMKGGNYSDNEWIDDLVENSEMDNKDVHLLNFIDPLDPSSMERFPISNIYIIFNKSNIKLADGSNTTFDDNNDDIRYAGGGGVKYLKGKKSKIWNILKNNYLTKFQAEENNYNYSQLNIWKEDELSEMIDLKAINEENSYDFEMFENQIAKILKDKSVNKIELEYGDYEMEKTNWFILYEDAQPKKQKVSAQPKKQKVSAENKALIKQLIKGIPKSTYNDFDDDELPYELLVYADKYSEFEVTDFVKFKNITELDKVFDEIITKHKNKLLRIEFRWSEYYGYPDAIEIYNSQEFEEDEAPKFEDGGDIDYSDFRTSVIGLINDNKVLILQRGSTANWMPNKWSIVGGVIEEGEVPIESMIRECEEEIGLKPSNVSYDHKIMTTDSGEIYYFNGTLKSKNIKLDYENSAYKFISKDEIDNYDFVPYVKEFILQIFSRNEKKNLYKSGGSVLLAPNGKPSNLTPEQYKLVREPAFKEWFGDWENDPENASKVVDENGEPLPVYHGTNEDFNIFKSKKNFFTPSKKSALWFAKVHRTSDGEPKVYEVFLNSKKLFNPFNLKENEKKSIIILVENHDNKDDFYEDFYFFKNDWNMNHLSDSEFILKVIQDNSDTSYTIIESRIFQDWLIENKYDGFMVGEYDFETPNYAVYNSNQIKLADGTNTTFDGGNPDIRFAKGGDTKLNIDRYREIEKEMFELRKQGKGDTLEYFKLIKERSIL